MFNSGQNSSNLITALALTIILTGCNSITMSIETEIPVPVENSVSTINCPENFVPVPASASAAFGLNDFCIAKYEMKAALNNGTRVLDGNNGGVQLDATLHIPVSAPSGTPWVRISMTTAWNECKSLGSNYSLITLEQWNAVARDVENVGANWTSGTTGLGRLYQGHTDGVIDVNAVVNGHAYGVSKVLSANDGTDPYIGTGNNSAEAAGSGLEQSRTHQLSNGLTVWDMAGNARDIVDADGSAGTVAFTNAFGSSVFHELLSTDMSAAVGSMISSNGVSLQLDWFTPTNVASVGANGAGYFYIETGAQAGKIVTRGGNFATTNARGIFGGDIDGVDGFTPTLSSNGAFRCVYEP